MNQLVNATSPGGYHVSIKEKNIYMLHDVPHIIKNIRTALSQYDICFDKHKVAKWAHITEAYKIDLTRRFQGNYIYIMILVCI